MQIWLHHLIKRKVIRIAVVNFVANAYEDLVVWGEGNADGRGWCVQCFGRLQCVKLFEVDNHVVKEMKLTEITIPGSGFHASGRLLKAIVF